MALRLPVQAERSTSSAGGAPASRTAAGPVLRLHEAIGNRAVSSLLQRATLQRACGCNDADPTCGCDDERKLARSPSGSATPAGVPPIVLDVLRSPGTPLDPATRARFEARLGHDLGRVRVHTGAAAAASAAAVHARAYTVGPHVVFRSAPHPTADESLVAHELVHTIQQRGVAAGSAAPLEISSPGDAAEREADRVAAQVVGASAVPRMSGGEASPHLLHRQQNDSSDSDRACYVDVCSVGAQFENSPARHLFLVHGDAAGHRTGYRGGPEHDLVDQALEAQRAAREAQEAIQRDPGNILQHGRRAFDQTANAMDPGNIRMESGPYARGFADYDPNATCIRVLAGAAACDKKACLDAQVLRINRAAVHYGGYGGPNSNTAARSLLQHCGLDQRHPPLRTVEIRGQRASELLPGWSYTPLP